MRDPKADGSARERRSGICSPVLAVHAGLLIWPSLANALPQCGACLKFHVDPRNVICAFATDGRIAAYDLQVLSDDRGFFPPYDAAPVVRTEFLKKHPELRQALAGLAGLLDDKTMQRLNYAVEGRKRPPFEVAREFLTRKRLIRADGK